MPARLSIGGKIKRLLAPVLGLFLLAAIPAQAQTAPPNIIAIEIRDFRIYGGRLLTDGEVVPRRTRIAVQFWAICDGSGIPTDIDFLIHYHTRHDRVKEAIMLNNWETRPAYGIKTAQCSWQADIQKYAGIIDYSQQDTHGPGFDSPLGFNMYQVHLKDATGVNVTEDHVWWCGEQACPPPLR